MNEGAADFLLKGTLKPGELRRAIERAIERSRTIHELSTSRDRLRKLAHHLQASMETERTRISRNIYHEIVSTVSSLKADLSWLDEKLSRRRDEATRLLRERLSGALMLADDLSATAQHIVYELRPIALDDYGLSGALREEVWLFEQRTGLTTNLEVHDSLHGIPESICTSAFRILQELLNNVAHHAHARTVHIELLRLVNELYLEVRDDGIGMADSALDDDSSLGLIGILERVESLNGTAEFVSKPGNGTAVTIRIPLSEMQ